MGSMDATAIRRAYESSVGPAKVVTGGGMPGPRHLLSRDRRVVPRAPQGRSGRRQMRLAAMPAAELQETGRIPPNVHHSMPEDGCRPCSGLDPPIGMSPWNVSSSRLPLAFVFCSSPSRHRGVKGQKVKVGAKASRRRVAAAKAAPSEGREGYFSRGQLSFPGQQGRRCTLRAARGARGG